MIPASLLEYPTKPVLPETDGGFAFAAVGLAHGHIYAMCANLIACGATLKYVYDDNAALIEAFTARFPQVKIARSYDEILLDKEIRLVASADIPSFRASRGIAAMKAGKDFLADKAPFTTLEQLNEIKETIAETHRKYFVFYSERLASDVSEYANILIKRGVIGRVVNVIGFGPHKLANGERRGDWFYKRDTQGGILIDIGSHQIEQFLTYTGAEDAVIDCARIANFAHKEHPGFDDFGDCSLHAENGATGHFRVDWFTPLGVKPFGDGKTLIEGTKGFIEMRKYADLGISDNTDNIIIATDDGVEKKCVAGQIGLPYFPALIRDCIERTETAMTQEHALKATELAIRAQMAAVDLER